MNDAANGSVGYVTKFEIRAIMPIHLKYTMWGQQSQRTLGAASELEQFNSKLWTAIRVKKPIMAKILKANEFMNKELDRCKGALLGLYRRRCAGNNPEFKRPGTFTPIADMVGGGPFALAPGQWTDDTSMALCLADSLIETDASMPLISSTDT